MLAFVGGGTALFLGIYGARESSRVVGGAVERWLGTPSLVGVFHGLFVLFLFIYFEVGGGAMAGHT